ncbi:hypothetical protein I6N91_06600 [Arthrobacter sp. MSA 4-2]|uniref:hypothetical protein n=1 Tax=Arthrobacter sp. MSA 4-2 TaxID=2794349 RepID=UPI0018E8BD96|nr:hypothetical protein [Arthrobacter sp. MSA 4-2]MBJ2120649.1 hypothetical protein [Arthrobacter sp. MSA 4-2]
MLEEGDSNAFEELIEREGYLLRSSDEVDRQYNAAIISGSSVTVGSIPLLGHHLLAEGPIRAPRVSAGSAAGPQRASECSAELQHGVEAAQICVINGLALIRSKVASLSELKAVTELTLFINADSDFTQKDEILEAAISLLSSLYPLSPDFVADVLDSSYLPMNSSVSLAITFSMDDEAA